MSDLTLTKQENTALTQYERATDQLRVLHQRGFNRAFIGRLGKIVLERGHYDSVIAARPEPHHSGKVANLKFA